MKEYEVEFEYVGNLKRMPKKLLGEYGFYQNPPLVLHAKSKGEALSQLSLPKSVKVARIVEVGGME